MNNKKRKYDVSVRYKTNDILLPKNNIGQWPGGGHLDLESYVTCGPKGRIFSSSNICKGIYFMNTICRGVFLMTKGAIFL